MDGVLFLVVDDIRVALAFVAKRFFGEPDEELYMYFVTGTNGKTSITYLLEHLEARKTAILGTIGCKIGHQDIVTSNTTPGAIGLFGLLDQARRNGCEAVAMEASSQALHQRRLFG
jgi:UDP-N-acetylmuramoyl-L-alanyl-D-glutamate--2,6-diaminopimelate ligase